MREQGWADFLRDKSNRQEVYREKLQLSAARLAKIRDHSVTKRVKYTDFPDAFDYVHHIYPFANVRQAIVYHTSQYLLHEVGYKGVGGFYDTNARVIVITNQVQWGGLSEEYAIRAEITLDEVLVHELIHYAANYKDPLSSRNLEEQIAYGHSIGYLRKKGHSDDYIINKNMMPFLVSMVEKNDVMMKILIKHYDDKMLGSVSSSALDSLIANHQKEVFEGIKAEAYKIGEQIIREYSQGQCNIKPILSRRRNLIIDDEL